jgi:hypothetical protein
VKLNDIFLEFGVAAHKKLTRIHDVGTMVLTRVAVRTLLTLIYKNSACYIFFIHCSFIRDSGLKKDHIASFLNPAKEEKILIPLLSSLIIITLLFINPAGDH